LLNVGVPKKIRSMRLELRVRSIWTKFKPVPWRNIICVIDLISMKSTIWLYFEDYLYSVTKVSPADVRINITTHTWLLCRERKKSIGLKLLATAMIAILRPIVTSTYSSVILSRCAATKNLGIQYVGMF